MKIRDYSILLWSYFFFILANAADVFSSIGNMEANELMQQSPWFPLFDVHKAIRIKLLFLAYYLILSLYAYITVAHLNRRVAIWVAAILPMQSTYILIQVALHNLL